MTEEHMLQDKKESGAGWEVGRVHITPNLIVIGS
jgi:hypothetical protein